MTDALGGLVTDDVALVGRIDAIPSILEIACQVTGLRFAAVARVTETSWIACAVHDEIAFGLGVGGKLDLKTTICDEIRDTRAGVIIDHVAEDNRFRNHHTPRTYGFESYISVPILRRDGSFFGTLCALDPLPAQLARPGVLATFESFAKVIGLQLDAQEELMRREAELSDAGRTAVLREQFIAILGHDLRNPVAAIEAGTRLLERMNLGERPDSIIDRIGQSTRRIARLVDDLLDFARGRLGSGLVLVKNQTDDLADRLEQVVMEIRLAHPDRQVDFEVRLAEPVNCDAERIAQLLSNLLSNALTHGAANQPVTVFVSSSGGEFTLSVVNYGPPIAAELLPTLFQPFARGANGRLRNGLGLGLFIANEIAKAHHGRIDVKSASDMTRFTLGMPRGSVTLGELETVRPGLNGANE